MGIIGTFEGFVTSPLYLFNNGSWSNLQTTGWNGEGTNVSDGRVFTASGKITSSGTPFYASKVCSLKQTFNLSNYRYIKITTIRSGYACDGIIGISSKYGGNKGDFISFSTSASSGTTILDISSINGSYYIYVGMYYYMSYTSRNWEMTIIQLYLTNS